MNLRGAVFGDAKVPRILVFAMIAALVTFGAGLFAPAPIACVLGGGIFVGMILISLMASLAGPIGHGSFVEPRSGPGSCGWVNRKKPGETERYWRCARESDVFLIEDDEMENCPMCSRKLIVRPRSVTN